MKISVKRKKNKDQRISAMADYGRTSTVTKPSGSLETPKVKKKAPYYEALKLI